MSARQTHRGYGWPHENLEKTRFKNRKSPTEIPIFRRAAVLRGTDRRVSYKSLFAIYFYSPRLFTNTPESRRFPHVISSHRPRAPGNGYHRNAHRARIDRIMGALTPLFGSQSTLRNYVARTVPTRSIRARFASFSAPALSIFSHAFSFD